MIEVSVMYPKSEGAVFNIDYYNNKHVPMVIELLGDDLKSGVGDSGIAGSTPEEAATYIAMGHPTFESVEAFQNSIGPKAEKILSDLPNFTNTQPQIKISKIKL